LDDGCYAVQWGAIPWLNGVHGYHCKTTTTYYNVNWEYWSYHKCVWHLPKTTTTPTTTTTTTPTTTTTTTPTTTTTTDTTEDTTTDTNTDTGNDWSNFNEGGSNWSCNCYTNENNQTTCPKVPEDDDGEF